MREGAPGANDCFRPPEIPIQVYCAHCRLEFDSYLMQWVSDPSYASGGYWACPTPGCDGKGFTLDIWPTDPDWTDEHGNKVCFFDDEDPLLDEWDGDYADEDPDDQELANELAPDDNDDEFTPDDDPGQYDQQMIQVIADAFPDPLIPIPPDMPLDDERDMPFDEFDDGSCEDGAAWDDPDRARDRTHRANHRITDTPPFYRDDDAS